MIRVLVAEDSATARELLVAILEGDPEIRVVGQAKNGVEAVELAKRLRPNLITMDVHMPVMDGLAATKEIMVQAPTPIIIVSSSSSGRDIDMSLNALRAGALTVVAKPHDPHSPAFNGREQQFLSMVKAMADVKVVRRWARAAAVGEAESRPEGEQSRLAMPVVAIAASTGGPAALQQVLGGLPAEFPAPVLIVQHIARGFSEGLADWLAASCALHVKVAKQGEALAPRTVYLAPDDRHVGLDGGERIAVLATPPVEGFRPSATVLFESVARHAGSRVTAVVLTGMGADGSAGLSAVRSAGGRVIAQDEATSVVYGMPRAALDTGHVQVVLPLGKIAGDLIAWTGRQGRTVQRGA